MLASNYEYFIVHSNELHKQQQERSEDFTEVKIQVEVFWLVMHGPLKEWYPITWCHNTEHEFYILFS